MIFTPAGFLRRCLRWERRAGPNGLSTPAPTVHQSGEASMSSEEFSPPDDRRPNSSFTTPTSISAMTFDGLHNRDDFNKEAASEFNNTPVTVNDSRKDAKDSRRK
jgi:hypothetical protein